MTATATAFVDLVFHVLAHVSVDVPAGAYDPEYVRWCERTLGPASSRELATLASDVARAAPTHDALARAQLLAWMFRDVQNAARAFDRSLAELRPDDVARPELLRALAGDPAAELLFCAVALEAGAHASLPAIAADAAFGSARAEVARAAPRLAEMPVETVRSLRLRGRVYDATIFVGVPSPIAPGAPVEHVAWQAGHEATVAELAAARLPFDQHEHAAVVLLATRARRAGLAEGHARWLAQLRAPSPSFDDLGDAARAVVGAAIERSGT